jgi:rhodanese-related sulfurtransferase
VRNLRAAGYQGKLMNLLDGVQGWKNEVDPNVKLI